MIFAYLSISDIDLILCNCCLNLFSIHAFSSGPSFYRSLLALSELLVSGLFAVYTRVTDVSSWGSSIIMILGIPSIASASVSYLLFLISLVFVFNMWFKDLVCRSAFSGSFWGMVYEEKHSGTLCFYKYHCSTLTLDDSMVVNIFQDF